MGAGDQGLRDPVGRAGGPDGDAAAQGLGQGHQVGRHAVPFVCEQPAGAAHAGLHLVEHEQTAVAVGQLAQAGQEALGRGVDPALALYRLDQDRGSPVREQRLGGSEVSVRCVVDAGHQRFEALPVGGRSGGAHGEQRASVEAPSKATISKRSSPWSRWEAARELESGLVCFAAGVAEEHPVRERVPHQLLGQLDLGPGAVEVRDVPDQMGLLFERAHQRRVAVAQERRRDAPHQVQVAIAVGVLDPAALPSHEGDWLGSVVANEHGASALRDRLVAVGGGHATTLAAGASSGGWQRALAGRRAAGRPAAISVSGRRGGVGPAGACPSRTPRQGLALEAVANQLPGGVPQHHLSGPGDGRLQAAGRVHDVADHRVVLALGRSDVADHDPAGVDPIRIAMSRCASDSALSSARRSCIRSAHSTARAAWSGIGSGAPKKAIMPSPRNLSRVPSSSKTTSVRRRRCGSGPRPHPAAAALRPGV